MSIHLAGLKGSDAEPNSGGRIGRCQARWRNTIEANTEMYDLSKASKEQEGICLEWLEQVESSCKEEGDTIKD